MPHYRSAEQRFWSKVHKTRSCWICDWLPGPSMGAWEILGIWTAHICPSFRLDHGIWIAVAWHGHLSPMCQCCLCTCQPSCTGSASDNGRDKLKRPYGISAQITAGYRAKYGHRRTLEERFWEKVDKQSSPQGCWLWIAQCDPNGYGRFYVNKHKPCVLAHRFAWQLIHGAPIPNICLCHNCPGGGQSSLRQSSPSLYWYAYRQHG